MSNYLNFSIQTEEEMKQWILTMLGDPLITVELTDVQLGVCVDNAVEEFTKWVVQEQDYYAYDLTTYDSVSGALLPSNIQAIFSLQDDTGMSKGGINTLFSIPNTMFNAGMIPNFSGGGGWVDYHNAMSSIKFVNYMMGKGFQFEFNPGTHYMKLFPDPVKETIPGWIVLGTYIIRPDQQQYGESWCKRYALANAKYMLGMVRGKFQGVQLIGGGQVDASVREEGIQEMKELREELRAENPATGFFVG